MAICLKCGSVHNDMDEHECKAENIPPKGKEFIKGILIDNTKAIK